MSSVSIQIVEGNPHLRSLLGWHLQQVGYWIHQSADLQQAKDTFVSRQNYPNIRNIIATDAYDPVLVSFLPEFDIIIDDGPHWLEYQRMGIDLYLPKLKKGGLMVIEDVEDIKNIEKLIETVPNTGEYTTQVYDLREQDQRYDSIIFAIKRAE